MYAKRRNCRDLKEIGVEKHDGDVRFYTGSGYAAVSLTRNEKYKLIFMAESPKVSRHIENWGREIRW